MLIGMPKIGMSTQRIFWIIIILALMVWEGVVLYYLWVLRFEPSFHGRDGLPQLSLSDSALVLLTPTNNIKVSDESESARLQDLERLSRSYIQTMEKLFSEERLTELDQQTDILIYDLRPDDEYYQSHIKYALHTSLEGLTIILKSPDIFSGKDIILLTSLPLSEELRISGQNLEKAGAKSVHLYPNFKPEAVSLELLDINQALITPPWQRQ